MHQTRSGVRTEGERLERLQKCTVLLIMRSPNKGLGREALTVSQGGALEKPVLRRPVGRMKLVRE